MAKKKHKKDEEKKKFEYSNEVILRKLSLLYKILSILS